MGASSKSEVANFLDLAITCDKKNILEHLVNHGVTNHREEFEDFLMKTEFLNPGAIFSEVTDKDPKLSLSILHSSIDIVTENDEDEFIKMDLKFFKGPTALESMIVTGQKELFFHPLIESQARLKWESLQKIFFAFLVWNILFTSIFSLFVIFDMSHHQIISISINNFFPGIVILLVLSILLYLPISLIELITAWITHKNLRSKPKLFIQILFFLLFLFIVSSRPYHENISYSTPVIKIHNHISSWTILLAWLKIFLIIQDIPSVTIYVHMFLNVFCTILKFILVMVSLLVGFCLSFHIILPFNKEEGGRFRSPINAFIKLISMLKGEHSFDNTFNESIVNMEGTTQLIFIIFFFIGNIVIINIMIGLTITGIKETVDMKDQIKLVIMTKNIIKIEKMLVMIKSVLTRCKKYVKTVCNLLESNSSSKIFLSLKQETKSDILMLIDKKSEPVVDVLKVSDENREFIKTHHKLPKHIIDACSAIVLERRELEAAIEEATNTGGDYTSVCGDNQYEEIQEESKYGLRGIKESLLRVYYY